ncbi:MAG: hypothetical protein WD649_05390 [Thermoleophilaceae bacterium]
MPERLRDERGVAVASAMAVMAIVLILVAAISLRSVGLSNTSNDDRDSKRALAAAEAGLQAATFRINRLAPTNALCVTDVIATPLPLGCPTFEQDMGNDARYEYSVTPVLNLSDECAGLPIQTGASGLTVLQRCITAVGEVNGVQRRAQARVAAFEGNPIFPVDGIIGLEGVDLKNTATIDGFLGSNGPITVNNGSTITGGIQLGPGAPAPSVGGSDVGEVTYRTNEEGGFVLAPVEIGNSASVNDNVRIPNGLASPKLSPYDSSSGVTYDAGTRTLTMSSNSSLTLGGGTYNFCQISMGNNSQITIAPRPPGQPQGVRLFVDSPYRSGSGCSGSGAGTFTMGQGSSFGSPPGGDPRNLQIYVYGWSDAESATPSVIEFNNSSFAGAIYAPQSHLIFKNSATVGGGIAGRSVEFKNSLLFDWDEGVGDIRARTLRLFYRTSWKECPKEPSDPDELDSGC